MSAELPSPEVRATIIERLSELIIAIEAHPAWNPENPHRGLFHVWDFVSRSRYIMTELDHIRDGEPVQYPEQIRQQSGLSTGPAAAAESFADVCGRAVTVNELVSTPRLLTMMGLPQVDYGSDVTSKSQAVVEVVNQAR
ncbi:hypothetical protein K4K49_010186 [Colletotrichum sp. SAR 10_70]|nr:uncharacterized protein CGMCC3_g16213 [Colletotrichum fructicola]KAF4829096.1 hypothetical protein CGCTS75_v006955 [Colletotrichum tropicale]KAF4918047.1 hypothetical protein CGCVW01_v009255 [Colletotrichum viniferum]KAI8151572.1 hypothetical protein K4K50_010468 [Colletotrichum sp. SAR 10_71]KAI8153668.1 hypothetical protein K4K49_010186 [Colletotrichum sp. SAR 10_70]KAI8158869.1 hypothetical protein KHU50_009067 [Colletotrichum sp. SAR 10_65]KAI8172911.1 hypothetical protein K4K51_010522